MTNLTRSRSTSIVLWENIFCDFYMIIGRSKLYYPLKGFSLSLFFFCSRWNLFHFCFGWAGSSLCGIITQPAWSSWKRLAADPHPTGYDDIETANACC